MLHKTFLSGLAALIIGSGAAFAQTTLDMTSEYEANSLHGEGDQFFADKVTELSGGDVEIVLHLGGALGFKSKDNLDAVGDGIVPIADTLGGTLAGSDPIFLLSSLPFVAAGPKDARTLYETARPAYEAFFEKNGQILLYASPWTPSGLWSNKAVNSPEALQGFKLRTYDANGTRTMIEAGAAPIQLSWADVVPQLATGGIDGVLTSAEGGVFGKFWEHLSHFSEVNYALPLNFVHMNADMFENLDEDAQQSILDAAAATDARNWAQLETRIANNYRVLRDNDVAITEEISPEFQQHLADAAETVIDQWKGEARNEYIDILNAYGDKVDRAF